MRMESDLEEEDLPLPSITSKEAWLYWCRKTFLESLFPPFLLGDDLLAQVYDPVLYPVKRCFPKLYKDIRYRLFLNPYCNKPFFICIFVYCTLLFWTVEGVVEGSPLLSLLLAYFLYCYKKTFPLICTAMAFCILQDKKAKGNHEELLFEGDWEEDWIYYMREISMSYLILINDDGED